MSDQEKRPDATIHTVIIQTTRIKEMAAFYGQGLGLGEPVATGGDHLGFPLRNVYFGIDLVEQSPAATGVISLWFEVEDIEATFNQLKDIEATFSLFERSGAVVKYPPSKKPWGAVLAALHDPDGNIFGLTQRGTNPEY
jgi:catechol 2,3-dioxygenase-like lactoylglutathione lyase family enzyme